MAAAQFNTHCYYSVKKTLVSGETKNLLFEAVEPAFEVPNQRKGKQNEYLQFIFK